MTKETLRKLLAREVERWSRKTFLELCSHLKNSTTYVTKTEEGSYQTEVVLLEATKDYCHVGVSVDDMMFWRAIKPLSTSFLTYKDGRVERDEG